ncbi:MAG: hypothetical protein ACKVIH_11535 [Burkholderiales bacterium]
MAATPELALNAPKTIVNFHSTTRTPVLALIAIWHLDLAIKLKKLALTAPPSPLQVAGSAIFLKIGLNSGIESAF